MRLACVIAALIVVPFGTAAAQSVPSPRQRPATLNERFAVPPITATNTGSPVITSLAPAPELQGLTFPHAEVGPTACELRLAEIAAFTPLPKLIGPGECGAADVVRLDAVVLANKTQVTLNPPATLRCSMAETVAQWVRDDVAPLAAELGAPLAAIANYDSFECRGRNRVIGAKLSEHGRANALDIRGIRLANGTLVELTSPVVAKDFREAMRKTACTRFMTVLGPGADGYHESHIHLDLAERARGHRMCQWEVREPPVAVTVPLPVPRPTVRAEATATSSGR